MPNIPLDVVHLIAVNSAALEAAALGDRSKIVPRLRVLALTSRSWLQPCRKILFSQYTLGNFNYLTENPLQLPRFLFFLTHPHLAVYVTILRITDIHITKHAHFILTNVHEVFPNTASLMINDGMEYVWEVNLIFDIIRGFPYLHNLDLRMKHFTDINQAIDNVAFPSLLLQTLTIIIKSGWMSNLLRVLARSPSAQTLRNVAFELRYAIPEHTAAVHRVLNDFTRCTQLKLMYTNTNHKLWSICESSDLIISHDSILTKVVIITDDSRLSIGHHRFLTLLKLSVDGRDCPAVMLHNFLFRAELPSLEEMIIELVLSRYQSQYDYSPIILEDPILSDAVVHNLTSLTFCFDGYGDLDVTIEAWSGFQDLFGVPADSEVVKYALGSDASHLPRLFHIAK
jgi:hypothetical protein